MPEIKFVLPIIGYIISGIALCFGAYTEYISIADTESCVHDSNTANFK